MESPTPGFITAVHVLTAASLNAPAFFNNYIQKLFRTGRTDDATTGEGTTAATVPAVEEASPTGKGVTTATLPAVDEATANMATMDEASTFQAPEDAALGTAAGLPIRYHRWPSYLPSKSEEEAKIRSMRAVSMTPSKSHMALCNMCLCFRFMLRRMKSLI